MNRLRAGVLLTLAVLLRGASNEVVVPKAPTPDVPIEAIAERASEELPAKILHSPAPVPVPVDDPWEVPAAAAPSEVYNVAWDARLTVYETTVDPALGGRVSGPDGVGVVFPADGLALAGGVALDGPVTVRWSLVREPEQVVAVPGNLAVRMEGRNIPLQSFGMVWMELEHPAGEVEVQTPARLSFPLAEGHGFEDGDEVGIYVLDPASGLWVHEGDGAVQDGRFTRVAMTRQGWWNCDAPLSLRGCVRGRIVHAGWELPADTAAHLVGTEYITRSVALPDADGGFCVDGMPAVPARIEAYQTGAQCFRFESAMVAASKAGTSCFQDASACTEVELVPVSVSCELAADALEGLKNSPVQARAVERGLWRGHTGGTFRIEAPADVSWAMVHCGSRYRQLLEGGAGVYRFEHVPLSRGICDVSMGDGESAWTFGGLAGDQVLECSRKRRSMRCISDTDVVSVK